MQLGIQVLPSAGVEAGRDPWERQGCFPAQPGRDGQLGAVALGPCAQLVLLPSQSFQLFTDDPGASVLTFDTKRRI